MKTCLLVFAISFVLLFATSCVKETASEPEAIKNEASQNTSGFDSCQCASNEKSGTGDYIRATLDGVPVCFDVVPVMAFDTFPNMMKWGYVMQGADTTYYDNLYMIRNTADGLWQLALFFENTHALTKSYPYILPRSNPEVCEIGELQLNNTGHYTSCTFCAENEWNYYAQFYGSGVRMTVNSFDNDVFAGTFSGSAATGSGKSVGIENGEFRIHLTVFRSDITLPQ